MGIASPPDGRPERLTPMERFANMMETADSPEQLVFAFRIAAEEGVTIKGEPIESEILIGYVDAAEHARLSGRTFNFNVVTRECGIRSAFIRIFRKENE